MRATQLWIWSEWPHFIVVLLYGSFILFEAKRSAFRRRLPCSFRTWRAIFRSYKGWCADDVAFCCFGPLFHCDYRRVAVLQIAAKAWVMRSRSTVAVTRRGRLSESCPSRRSCISQKTALAV